MHLYTKNRYFLIKKEQQIEVRSFSYWLSQLQTIAEEILFLL